MDIKKTISLKEVVNSLAVALVICAQYLNAIYGIYVGGSILSPTLLLATVLAIIAGSSKLKIRPGFALVIGMILGFYFLTIVFRQGQSDMPMMQMFAMCIIPCCIGAFSRPNYKVVMRLCMIILCLGIPVFQEFYTKGNMGSSYDAITMGNSYAIVPVIMIGVVYGVFFWKSTILIDKILVIVAWANLIELSIMSYRGALLAAILILGVAILTRKEHINRKQSLVLILVITISFFVIANIQTILIALNTFLQNRGIAIAALRKSVYLEGEGNLLHGRLPIWQRALQGFLDSPIYGNGISTFQYNTGIVFPHNLVIQFLYDGGLIMAVPLVTVIIFSIKDVFAKIRHLDKYFYGTMLTIMGVSICRTIFSANTWRIIPLWLFVGVVSNYCYEEKDSDLLIDN